MRQLLLFLAVATASVATAQQPGYIPYTGKTPVNNATQISQTEMKKLYNASPSHRAVGHSGAKTTLGPSAHANWYDMWTQNTSTGTGSPAVAYYWGTMPDSNVLDNTGTTSQYMWVHGMGQTFDPTDSAYFDFTVNGGALVTGIPPADILPQYGQAYDVDSFYDAIVYKRNDPTTTRIDSLIIELVITQTAPVSSGDSGAYSLQVATWSSSFTSVALDGKPRWGDIRYNAGLLAPYNVQPYINDCYFDSVFTTRQRFALVLNSATVADTDVNGFLNLGMLPGTYQVNNGAPVALTPTLGQYALNLATPIHISNSLSNQRQHLVTYVTFKPQANYPFGTLATAANWIKQFAGEPNGMSTRWMQSSGNPATGYLGSFSMSLIASNQIRYSDTGFTLGLGHNVLIPSFAYATNPGFEVTFQAFHIKWTGVSLGATLPDAEHPGISVYPNPADNIVTIKTDQQAYNSFTIVNNVGQNVLQLPLVNSQTDVNVSKLPTGMYYIIFHGSNGTATCRFVKE